MRIKPLRLRLQRRRTRRLRPRRTRHRRLRRQTANQPPQNNTSQTFEAVQPYYDVYSIVQNKGSYNDSRYVNGSSDYDKYRVAAEEYYNKLKSSGYSDVADELSNSSYEKALEILARYQPDSTSASTNISSNNVGDVAANYLSQIENYISPSTNTQNVLSSSAQKAEQLLNSYLSGVDSTNQQSQNYQDNIYKYINDQSGRYGSLNNYNLNTNPYDTETAKSILATYGVKGANASDNAIADSSGDNGGNIDSYAAANAKRQQLAFTTAGNEAVLSDFDSRVTRSLQILQSLGVDVGDALDKVGSNIDSQITQNANTLSGANTAMSTAVNGAVTSDANKTTAVSDILKNLLSLKTDAITAETDKYKSDSDLTGTNYSSDKSLEGTKYSSDKTLEGSKYTDDKTLEGTKDTNKTDKEIEAAHDASDIQSANIKSAASNSTSASSSSSSDTDAANSDYSYENVENMYDELMNSGTEDRYSHNPMTLDQAYSYLLEIFTGNSGMISKVKQYYSANK